MNVKKILVCTLIFVTANTLHAEQSPQKVDVTREIHEILSDDQIDSSTREIVTSFINMLANFSMIVQEDQKNTDNVCNLVSNILVNAVNIIGQGFKGGDQFTKSAFIQEDIKELSHKVSPYISRVIQILLDGAKPDTANTRNQKVDATQEVHAIFSDNQIDSSTRAIVASFINMLASFSMIVQKEAPATTVCNGISNMLVNMVNIVNQGLKSGRSLSDDASMQGEIEQLSHKITSHLSRIIHILLHEAKTN